MPIFPQVISCLRDDDTILAIGNFEFLDVEVSEELWGNFNKDAEELAPKRRLTPFAVFVKQLYNLSERMEDLPFLPDPRSPQGTYKFKENENIILVFCGDNPVWYWEKTDNLWQLYAMRVTKNSNVEEALDPNELDREIEELLQDLENQDLENDEEEDGPKGNDPEYLTPDANLGVFRHFISVLEDGHAQLEGEPYCHDTANPNSSYRFRFNDRFIVAYRCMSDSDCQPVWCWRKQEDGFWKLYRLRISVTLDDLFDLPIERVLTNGTWESAGC